MTKMVLKVKMPGRISAAAILNSGVPKEGQALTFHAYSDQVKASVLGKIATGQNIQVSWCYETPRQGEWFE